MVSFLEGIFANFVASFLPGGNNVLGAAITLWLFAVFFISRWCWRRIRERKIEIRTVVSPLALIALSLIGVGGGLLWLMQATPSASQVSTPLSIRGECEFDALPQTMPSDGRTSFLPIDIPYDQRNIPEGPLPRPFLVYSGVPGSPTAWKKTDGSPRTGYVCTITNYAKVPIFNIYLGFQLRFVEVKDNAAKPENTVAVKSITAEIPRLDYPGNFVFYVKNDGMYFVEATINRQATAQIADGTRHDVIVILPTSGITMGLFSGK